MSEPASILSISPLLDELKQQTVTTIETLGRAPRLALLRCVSEPGSMFMEKQIRAACRDTGVECWFMELPSYLAEDVLVKAVHQIGQDNSVDAVGLLCPPQYDKSLLGSAIGEQKDINGYCRTSSSRFLPCFDGAVSQILDHFQIPCDGKQIRACRSGRFFPRAGLCPGSRVYRWSSRRSSSLFAFLRDICCFGCRGLIWRAFLYRGWRNKGLGFCQDSASSRWCRFCNSLYLHVKCCKSRKMRTFFQKSLT